MKSPDSDAGCVGCSGSVDPRENAILRQLPSPRPAQTGSSHVVHADRDRLPGHAGRRPTGARSQPERVGVEASVRSCGT